MSEKEIKLENYLSKSAQDWMVHPIQSNAELTKLAELLAERHGVFVDKVYGKDFAPKGDYIQADQERVDTWINKGYQTLAYMSSVGFFTCDVSDAIGVINFVKKDYRIPVSIMKPVCQFSEVESTMVKMARASRKQGDKNQTNLF